MFSSFFRGAGPSRGAGGGTDRERDQKRSALGHSLTVMLTHCRVSAGACVQQRVDAQVEQREAKKVTCERIPEHETRK